MVAQMADSMAEMMALQEAGYSVHYSVESRACL